MDHLFNQMMDSIYMHFLKPDQIQHIHSSKHICFPTLVSFPYNIITVPSFFSYKILLFPNLIIQFYSFCTIIHSQNQTLSMENSKPNFSQNLFDGFSDLQHRNKSQRNLGHLSFNINRMRRRSGGIHCQSPEEFIQLSEKSLQSTGLFYEDKFNRDCLQKSSDKFAQKRKNVFSSFDFDIDEEESKDEKTLDDQISSYPSINVTNVIICQETEEIRSILDPRGLQTRGNDSRSIDLVVRHRMTSKGQKYIFKYWLIEEQTCHSVLAQIYLAIAKQIFTTLDSSVKHLQKISKCNPYSIYEKLEAEEQKLLQLP